MISSLVLAGVIVASIYIDTIIEDFVSREIKNLAAKHQDRFEIKIEEVNSTFILRRVTLNQVSVISKDRPSAKIEKFDLKLDRLVIALESIMDAIQNKRLSIRSLSLKEPDMNLYFRPDSTYETTQDINQNRGSQFFDDVVIKQLSLNEASLSFFQSSASDSMALVADLKGLTVEWSDVFYTFSPQENQSAFSYRDFEIEAGLINLDLWPQIDLKFEGFTYGSSEEFVSIEQAIIRSNSSNETHKVEDKIIPYVEGNINTIQFDLPVEQLFNQNFKLQNLNLGKTEFTGHFITSSDSSSVLQSLSELNSPLSIDAIDWHPMTLNLALYDSILDKSEYLQASNLNVKLSDFDLNETSVNKTPIHLHLSGNLWEKATLESYLKLTRDSIYPSLEGWISLNHLSYQHAKKVLEKRIDIDLTSGQIDHMKVAFNLDSNLVKGSLDLAVSEVIVGNDQWLLPEGVKDLQIYLNRFNAKGSLVRKLSEPGSLKIDTLQVFQPDISWVNSDSKSSKKIKKWVKESRQVLFNTLNVNYLLINDIRVRAFEKSRGNPPFFMLSDGRIKSKNIKVRDLDKKIVSYDPAYLLFEFNDCIFNKTGLGEININHIGFESNKKKLELHGARYKSNGSKFDFLSRKISDPNWLGLYVEHISSVIDLKKWIKGVYRIPKINIQNPIITWLNDPNMKSSKKETTFKNITFPLTIDKVVVGQGDFKYSVRTDHKNEYKVLTIQDLNCHIVDFTLDSAQKLVRPNLKLDLIGKAFGKSHLNLMVDWDQRENKKSFTASFDVANLSLKQLNNRFFPLIDLKLNNGSINHLAAKISLKNEVYSGQIDLTDFEMKKLSFKPDSVNQGDYISFRLPETSLAFTIKQKEIDAPFRITSLVLNKPDITYHDALKTTGEKNEIKADLFYKGRKTPTIIIDDFELNHAKLAMGYLNEKKPHTAARNTDLSAKGIRFYTDTLSNSVLPLTIDDLELDMAQIKRLDLPDYSMRLNHIHYHKKEHLITFSDLRIKNNKTLVDLYKNQLYRKPWFDLFVPKFSAEFKLEQLIDPNPRIQNVTINEADFLFQFDYKLDINPKEKPLFTDMIKAVKIPYTLDELNISNSTVTIYMQENTPARSGYLIFNAIDGRVTNISSDPIQISKKPLTTIGVRTDLWGKGPAVINGTIDLSDPNKSFSLRGDVGKMDMTVADTLITDLFNISIKSGLLNGAHFEVNFDQNLATGFVNFDYQDLKVGLFKGQHMVESNDKTINTEKVAKEDKLNSGFVSRIIINGLIKEKNLPDKNSYVVGSVFYRREPDKPVFRYVWYSLSTGLIETIESGVVKTIRSFGKSNPEKEKKK